MHGTGTALSLNWFPILSQGALNPKLSGSLWRGWRKKNDVRPSEAVIDKDLASSVLAREIDADELIILTEVEKVAINFNKPNQQFLDRLTVAEARQYLQEKHFAPGSMGPKVQAVIDFLEGGGRKAVITSLEKAYEAINGRTGTHFTRG